MPGLLGPGLLTPGGFCANDTSTRHQVKYSRRAMGASRVIAYIDGFNLYHGLRDARLKDSRWLDLHGMCVSLLKPGERLELVRYFTSWVKDSPVKAARQAVYVDALRARGGIEIDFGHFLSKTAQCFSCGNVWKKNEEKKTDVNVAVRLLEGASENRFDTAMVVSGDSDLVPPIESVRRRFPPKRVVVAFPPRRRSSQLEQAASAAFSIYPQTIQSNHLPDPVRTSGGVELQAPSGWLPSTQRAPLQ